MDYKGYEGLTQAQIKEKIIVEFYTTHMIGSHKWYLPTTFEAIVSNNMKRSGSGYVSDYYQDLKQLLFIELWKFTPEKFCKDFFDDAGNFNASRFFGSVNTIMIRVGFSSIDYHTPNKGSLNDIVGFSSFNTSNISIDSAYEHYENGEYKLIAQIEKVLTLDDKESTYITFLNCLDDDEADIVEGWCNTIRKNHNMKQLKKQLEYYSNVVDGTKKKNNFTKPIYISLYQHLQKLKSIFTNDKEKLEFVEI